MARQRRRASASAAGIPPHADDTPVKLVGKIEKSLGDEKYLFRDSTGSVRSSELLSVIEFDDLQRGDGAVFGRNRTVSGDIDLRFLRRDKDH